MKIIDRHPQDGAKTLKDNHGRRIEYLRLSITDRCNLRCRYCMPAEGIPFVPHGQILSFEELLRLVRIFASLGVRKVRVTGGEPFVRSGLIDFLASLRTVCGIEEIHLTTNGVAVAEHLKALQEIGISGINLSLDTLRRWPFLSLTRRDVLNKVLDTLHQAIGLGISLKINTVVYQRINADDIVPLALLARETPIMVRFIEQMPFNGQEHTPAEIITGHEIRETLQQAFPDIRHASHNSGTAMLYNIPGFRGQIGIIQSYSRKFCHTCNKVRVTPVGLLKTCLYDRGVLDLRDMLRGNATDAEITHAVVECIHNRATDGHAAEMANFRVHNDSMSAIGG